MPRPRFAKLPRARQARIIEAAAHEFGALGYDDASINHILAQANVSKGAAYYYFDDKEDLFLTVVKHYLNELGVQQQLEQLPSIVTAETFWSQLSELYRLPMVSAHYSPWAYGVFRAAGDLWQKRTGSGPLAEFVQHEMQILAALLKRGQDLGVIRTDLPDELILAWVQAVDDANDRWLLAHWEELDDAALNAAADRIIDALRRLLTPARDAHARESTG